MTKQIIGPNKGPQTQLLSSPADIAIFGGAAGGGKTWGLLLEPVRNIKVPFFGAVCFRRTTPQITAKGGLWEESSKIYPLLGGVARETDHLWRFPWMTDIRFTHLEYENTVVNWQGSQIPLILWDELTHFTRYQFFYMLSRNRSTCGVRPYVRATCNPDPDSWVAEFIDWWIGEDGYAIPERSGVLRWFVNIHDQIIWANHPDELSHYTDDAGRTIPPKSMTFIPATVYDNPKLLDIDPNYIGNLHALDEIDSARLLRGNWKVRAAAGKVFSRDWYKILSFVPGKPRHRLRYWDFASTAKKLKKHDPDYTACALQSIYGDAFYLEDIQAYQYGPAEIEELFFRVTRQDVAQCKLEGVNYSVRWEQEPGSAGVRESYRLVKMLQGIDAQGVPSVGDKLARAKAFAAQSRIGNIYLIQGSWNSQWLNHMHQQPDASHDDIMDATVGSYNSLVIEISKVSGRGHNPRSSSSRL